MKIAVVDSSTSGHRETFYRQITRSWMSLGHHVFMVTPTPLDEEKAEPQLALNFEAEQVQDSIQTLGPNIARYPDNKEKITLSSINKKTTINHEMIDFETLLPLPINRPVKKKITVLRNALIRINNLKRLKQALSDYQPDLVYFACLDDFAPTLSSHSLLNRILPYNWSGLFVQSTLPTFKWWVPDVRPSFRHFNCISVGVLNEYTIDPLTPWASDVKRLPDFADLTPPSTNFPLAKQIKTLAAGRKIISLLGSINKRKGVDLLLRTIPLLDEDKYFFVIAGKSSLSPEEISHLEQIQGHYKNIFVELSRIPTEADFNALVAHSDIIFAVYHNFTGSSNLLTKAAAFKKPVIVAEGECMGRRVHQYKIGLTIHQDDADECYKVIEKLCKTHIPSEYFHRYLALHRTDLLADCFKILSHQLS